MKIIGNSTELRILNVSIDMDKYIRLHDSLLVCRVWISGLWSKVCVSLHFGILLKNGQLFFLTGCTMNRIAQQHMMGYNGIYCLKLIIHLYFVLNSELSIFLAIKNMVKVPHFGRQLNWLGILITFLAL